MSMVKFPEPIRVLLLIDVVYFDTLKVTLHNCRMRVENMTQLIPFTQTYTTLSRMSSSAFPLEEFY